MAEGLDTEVIGFLVLAFGHVDWEDLEPDVFLEQAGEDPRHGGG